MRRVAAYRANKVLYNFLRSNKVSGVAILPVNVCHSVVATVQYAGLQVQFVDIATETLCLSTALALESVANASLLIYVHTYGVEESPNDFYKQTKTVNPNIYIVDDRCLCLPELSVKDSAADLVLYSTGGKKQVDLGMGGVGFVAEDKQYEEISVNDVELLTNYIWTLDEKMLLAKMNAVIKHKEKLNAIYRKNLPANIQLLAQYQHWRFSIIVPNKDEILKAIFDAGLFASGHYVPQADDCTVATNLYNHIINLFNDFYYTEEQARRTCEIISKHI